MSKTIDQRVVEMQFDNRNFEKNVSTTMSSVEKLKKSLNFTGASKGLENVGTAAKKVNLNGLGSAVETVRAKFSALEVMGVTALANITNSAVNAGKRIVSALTIDPIKTGFQEYETQINAVQTILANTQSKGTTIDDVNAALNELNKYADQTIYNFTEMTRNIGTFTAAGVDLDKSVTAIKGIANLAAVSGSTSQQASTAMYQLSQAIAAGTIQLQDWNSVVNAGMGGEVFQNALKRTAEHFGTDVDAMIEKYGSFRLSLTEGAWLTTDVLTETLTQLSGAYTEADLIAQGYTESQAKEIVELANTAVSAATDVKTFTGMLDTIKESVQSGWAQTWELVIGDFEQAKELWSGFSETFGGIIQSVSDARNKLLEGALSSNWDKLTNQITDAGVAAEDFNDALTKTVKDSGYDVDKLVEKYGSLGEAFQAGAISSDLIVKTLKTMSGASTKAAGATEDMTDKLEYFQKVVDEVWKGNYKNSDTGRIELLTKAGYDYAQVQSLVNKTVDGHRLTLEDLSDAQLKSIGYTDEEVSKLHELAAQAEKTGTPLNDLIENITKPSGRDLLWDSITNVLTSIIDICKAVGKAWQDAFPPMTDTALYKIIEGIHALTEAIVPSADTLDKLTRTFKGLFAILDIIVTVITEVAKTAFGALSTTLGVVDIDILGVTASIGDAIAAFRDWLLEGETLIKILNGIGSAVETAVKAIKKLVDAFLNLPIVQNVVGNLGGISSGFQEVGKNAVAGLQNGLTDGLSSIPQLLVQIGMSLLNAIKEVLGIHSPSTEMAEVGENAVQGFINGFSDGASGLFAAIKNIGRKCLDVISEIDWSTVVATGLSVAMLYFTKRAIDIVSAISAPFQGIGDVLSGVGNILNEVADSVQGVFKSFSKVLNAKAFSIRAEAIKTLAVSIAILAGSLFLLSKIDTTTLLTSVGVLVALAATIGGLAFAISRLDLEEVINLGGFTLAVVGIAASMLIMASALKVIDSLDMEKSSVTVGAFVVMLGGLMAVLSVYGQLVRGKALKNIEKVGILMLKLSASIAIMAAVVKLLSTMSVGEIAKGEIAIAGFIGIITLLAKITNFAGKHLNAFGNMMLKLSVSIGLMTVVIKMISGLTVEDLIKGGITIAGFVGIIALLTKITNYGEKSATQLGATLLAMSASMLIMTGVIALIAGISPENIVKGEAAILGFVVIIRLMMKIVNAGGSEMPKVALTLLAMSAAIAILAGVSVMLSLLDVGALAKGITAVGVLGTIMAVLVYVTKYAQDIKGNLIVMTVAIGILAAAVAALSFIDPLKLAGSTAAISILMGMFALIIKSSANITSSIGPLIVMTTAVGLLAGVIYLLAQLPIESTIAAAGSMSALLLSLAASMKLIGSIGKIGPSTIASLAIMAATMTGLALILTLLNDMDFGSSIKTVASLSILLGALTAATAALALVGKNGGVAAAAQGALALDAVILIIGGLMAGIGALVTYFPQLEEFVNKGIGLLNDVAYGLGSFIGNVVGGFLSGATSGLPDIATNLSDFMIALQPFINSVRNIDEGVIDSAKSLAQMILVFTATDFITGIASWLTGGSSLTKFADDLVPFGEAMVAFSDSIKGKIDPESVNAAANAGMALAQLAKNLPKEGGLLQSFLGTADLGDFGEQLKAFGSAIVGFSQQVKGNIDPESVEAAANAGMTLANLANNLPKQNGYLQTFLGSQDLALFGEQLKAFGSAIVGFSQEVKGNIDLESVEAAANAGMTLANLASNLPKQNGFLQDFLGSQDLGVFGEQLKAFGEAIVGFSQQVKGNVDLESVEAAVNAGKTISGLANNLPKQNGFLQLIFGNQDMGKFGEQLVTFGEKFAEYADYIKDVDADVVTATTNAADSIVGLANSLPENKLFTNETTLDEFGKQLAKFGSYFSDYYENVSGINAYKLSAVVDEVRRLVDMARSMAGLDSSAMSSFGSNLTKLGKAGVDGFIKSFTDATTRVKAAADQMLTTFINSANAHKTKFNSIFEVFVNTALTTIGKKQTDFKTAGLKLSESLLLGVESKKVQINVSMSSLLENIVASIRNRYNDFRAAGVYLVTGFANGLSNNSTATRAARSLASDTIKAMQQELKIKSPSRVARDEVGRYIVEGIGEGIEEDATAEEAAAQKAQNITNAFQEEFDKLDMEEQTAQLESELNSTDEDYASKYERQMERVQLALGKYQNMLEVLGKEASETQKAYNEYLQEEIDLRELAAQKAQDAYEISTQWISTNKEAGNLNLIEELAAWKRVQSQYVEGTEQRIEADKEVLRLQEEIQSATEDYYSELTDLQEEANQKRIELDQNYEDEVRSIKEEANQKRLELDQEYADKTKSINDQLIADVEEVEKEYEDALKSRSDTLYNAYGLFDSVEEQTEVSGDTLMTNLKDQITAFSEWTKNINSLADRGVSSELIDELREMGPSSAAEIAALNKMTDEQLDQYVDLWKTKQELAEEQAEFELEDMRLEMKDTISQLKEDARIELKEYRATWLDEVDTLNEETDQKLKDLKDNWIKEIEDLDAETKSKAETIKTNWLTTVMGLTTETESEFSKMTMEIIDIVGHQAQWNSTGISMIEGILNGVIAHTPKLVEGVGNAMEEALEFARKTLGINSPSKEFEKLGRYSDEGFAVGLTKYASLITGSTENVGSKAIDSLKSIISKISESVNADIDAQPTIRPVLDLSDVEANAGRLNALFSRTQATKINTGMLQSSSEEIQNGTNTPKTGSVFQFTQNNYSPKALSRVEIYRQTKNQFSAMERMVTT